MEDDIREIALCFEAVKVSMQQNRDGHILRLAVNPNDTPEDVLRFPVGTRFQVALVPVQDNGEPYQAPIKREENKAIAMAAMLCKDEDFQKWMVRMGYADIAVESAVAQGLRNVLGITSRAELKNNREARDKLTALAIEFRDTFGTGEYKGGI